MHTNKLKELTRLSPHPGFFSTYFSKKKKKKKPLNNYFHIANLITF